MNKLTLLTLLPLLPLLFLCGCTTINAQKGTYFSAGDSTQVTMTFKDGKMTYYHHDSNLHSPIVRGYGHIVLGLGAEAAGAFAGGPVLGAGTAAVTSIVNRPTSRATPAPK